MRKSQEGKEIEEGEKSEVKTSEGGEEIEKGGEKKRQREQWEEM